MAMKYAVIAVDPGKATGVAFLMWSGEPYDLPVIELTQEVDDAAFSGVIEGAFLTAGMEAEKTLVACERFVINQATVRNAQAPWSLEQIGVLKHLCRVSRFAPPPEEIVFQAPVDAKNMFPNPALKKLDLWHKGGEGHALDALRHALLLLAKKGWVPSKLLEE